MNENYYTKQYWQQKVEAFSAKINAPFTHGSYHLRLNHARYVLEHGYIAYQFYVSKTKQHLQSMDHITLV